MTEQIEAPGLRKILVVEDEPDLQDLARIALGTMGGFDVHVIDNGDEALTVTLSFEPDMVLLDVHLPGIDGPATLDTLLSRKETRGIPVVFVSASVVPDELRKLKDLGVVDVIPKPYDPVGIADQLRVIWSRCNHG